jgi:hypothetical protein
MTLPDLAALEAARDTAREAAARANASVTAAKEALGLAEKASEAADFAAHGARRALAAARIAIAIRGDEEATARLRDLSRTQHRRGHPSDQRLINLGAACGGDQSTWVVATGAGCGALPILDLATERRTSDAEVEAIRRLLPDPGPATDP